MSQSTFSDLVDGVVNGIVEALTGRASMTQTQRDARAWMVREMVHGLRPEDVRQLMVASQAVLLHVLTIDAAGDEPLDCAAAPKLRALAAVANLNRTMTKNLDVLGRLQAQYAKASPASEQRSFAAEPMADHTPEVAISFQNPSGVTVPSPAVAPSPPLNRQQRRLAEREYARLARRMPASQSANRISAQ